MQSVAFCRRRPSRRLCCDGANIMNKKKETIIISENDIPEQELKKVIADAGYNVVSVSSEPYEKKGLFGRK